jgi:hypothetical protein
VSAIVFGASVGGSAGMLGTIGLISVAVVFAFLAGINLFTRDGNLSAAEADVERNAAAAQAGVGRSMWPLAAAVGAGGLVVGTISKPVVFKVSLIVLLAAAAEWMVQGFSERVSADSKYNEGIRKRLLHPLEFPLLAAVGAAVFIYSFSRIMLNIDKDAGRWVFMVIGAIITTIGFVFAAKRGMGKSTAAGIITVGALALVGVGIASAVSGQRTIEAHPAITSAVCLGTASEVQVEEVDARASQSVAAKSNPLANVYLTSDEQLYALNTGIGNVQYHEITVPRSDAVHVLFHNDSAEPRRLTVHLGTFTAKDGSEGSEEAECTTALEKGGTAFLSFKISKSQLASSTPYRFTVPGVEDQEIKLLVP